MKDFTKSFLARFFAPEVIFISVSCSLMVFLAYTLVYNNFSLIHIPASAESGIYRFTVSFLYLGKFVIIPFIIINILAVLNFSKLSIILSFGLGVTANIYLAIDAATFNLYRFHLDGYVLPELLAPDMGKDFFPSAVFVFKAAAALCLLVAAHWAIFLAAGRLAKRYGARLSVPLFMAWFIPALVAQTIYTVSYYRRDIRPDYYTSALPNFRPSPLFEITEFLGIAPARAGVSLPELDDAAGEFHYPLSDPGCNGPVAGRGGKPMNFVLVVVDTLRADTARAPYMPRLDEAVRQYGAVEFTNHLASGANTTAGLMAIFYSMPGKYLDLARLSRKPPVSISEFEKNGYDFGVYVSSSLLRPPLDQTVFVNHLDIKLQADGELPWQRDIASTDDFVNFVSSERNKPFFSFMFYDSVHASSINLANPVIFEPFLKSVDYTALDQDYDPTAFFNRYRQTAHQVDREIGRIFDILDSKGKLSNTVVIVTSDHGEEFNDNRQNYWGHASNFSKAQMHVPMYVFWPGKPASQNTARTMHYDLAPTIMRDFFNCTSAASDYSFGESLFSAEIEKPRTVPLATNALQGVIEGDKVTIVRNVLPPVSYSIDKWQILENENPVSNLMDGFLDGQRRFVKNAPSQ